MLVLRMVKTNLKVLLTLELLNNKFIKFIHKSHLKKVALMISNSFFDIKIWDSYPYIYLLSLNRIFLTPWSVSHCLTSLKLNFSYNLEAGLF
jgi:hypothetical protein